MLTPPDGLAPDSLVPVLAEVWGVTVSSLDYRAVGFGSHHWEVVDGGGLRFFLTVDDVAAKRHTLSEPVTASFGRLRAALATATDLQRSGASFVIAPILTASGEPVVWTDRRFAVALYPYIEGQSYAWDQVPSPAHRRGLLDLVVALHTAATAGLRLPPEDDFSVAHRDELEMAVNGDDALPERGPYTRRAARLLVDSAGTVTASLRRYDGLVDQVRREPGPIVVTHGETHPGNTMHTAAGWVLVDWDTTLLAPAERDLWSLDPGDGSVIDAYADDTGTMPQPAVLELYRLRWDLADIAVFVSQFRAPHIESADSETSWDLLRSLIGRLSA